jgi:hypothetical protein
MIVDHRGGAERMELEGMGSQKIVTKGETSLV